MKVTYGMLLICLLWAIENHAPANFLLKFDDRTFEN